MTQPTKFPEGHPFAGPLAPGVSPFDVADQLIAFRRNQFGGWTMKEGDDDGDDPDGDEDEDDPDLADGDTKVKVGDRTFKVSELQTIMAREKRQGKSSGQKAALKTLGFDSLEDAQAFIEQHRKPADDKSGKGGGSDDEATRRASERERQAEERERKAKVRERRADLRAALRDQGSKGEDLDDALVLLDRTVDKDYDEDDLDDAVAALKERRPGLFGATDDDEDDDKNKPTPPARNRGQLPQGRPRQRHTPSKVFGAGGLERAKRKGWVKD